MNHKELVSRAARWLSNSQGCAFVLTEPCVPIEQPDVTGWTFNAWCVVVEVKASRNDWLRDADKEHRSGLGVGNERWYFVPAGLISPNEVQEPWGLAYCHWNKVTVVKSAGKRSGIGTVDILQTVRLLVACLRRATLPSPAPPALLPGCEDYQV